MSLIGLFTFPFFNIEDNIRFAYLVGVGMILIAIVPIVINYKKIVGLKTID